MDWTEEQLSGALLKAHQAGDTKSAEMLTQEILKVRAKDPERKWAEEMRSKYEHGYEHPVPKGEGLARSALQGVSFGAGDEATAALAATMQPVVSDQDSGMDWQQRYDTYVANEQAKNQQFREEHPVAATVAEVGGAIPTAVALPSFTGRSLGGRVAAAAGTGGYQGGVYGFNVGDGNLASRLKSAGKFAGVGAAAGVAAPAVAAGARNLAGHLLRNQSARAVGMPAPAYDVLQRTVIADDIMGGQGARNIARGGPQAMIADAGPSAQTLLDTAMQRSGPAARVGRNAINQRVAQAGRQVSGALDDAFGAPGQSSSRALTVYGDKTNPLDLIYKRAYSKPIDYSSPQGMKIEALVRGRVPGEAIRAANKLMQIEGHSSKQILADIADDGTVTFRQMPDVRQIDYITRGLNEVADQADGKGKLGGTTQTGRAYGNLSRELRGTLKEAVPEYRDALNSAAGLIREGKAKEFGGIVLSRRVTRDDVMEMVSDMGDAELRKVSEGIRSKIDDTLAEVKRTMTDPNVDARETMQAVKDLSSRASREKIQAIIGEARAARLFNELDQATAALNLKANVARNSATFARTSMDDVVRSQTESGAINALRSGEPVGAGKRIVQAITGRTPAAKEQVADETYSAIVQQLTGPRGQQALEAVRQMQAAAQNNPEAAQKWGRLARMLVERNAALTVPGTR